MKVRTIKIKYLVDDIYRDKKGNIVPEAVNCWARIIVKKGYRGEGKYIIGLPCGKTEEYDFREIKYTKKHFTDAYCGLRKIGKKWYFYGAE